MFGTLEFASQWPWWWRFLVQLVLCGLAALMSGEAIAARFAAFGAGVHGRVQFALYPCLALFVLGALMGVLVAGTVPSLAGAGKWIWVLPVLGFVSLLRDSPSVWPNDALFMSPGEGGLGVVFCSMPAFTVAGYSYGMWLISIGRVTWRLIFASMAALALGAAAVTLRGFEGREVERFEKIRSVAQGADPTLASDRRMLCGSLVGELSLKDDVYVELLGERRSCEGDQLLQAGDPGPPRSFAVERVRVVLGNHAGAEGWTFDYGLLDPDWK